MNENDYNLFVLFLSISKKGWIKSVGNIWGGIGLTFEKELGKLPDSKYNPDFNDIEIKCSSRFSRYPLYLFTVSFDGPGENEIMRLTEKYGFNDPDFPDKKVMFRSITNEIRAKNWLNFKFDVDREEKKLFLCIYDSNGVLVERKSYISFEKLLEHIDTKLKKIAYIKASKKIIDGEVYYRYYSFSLYTIKTFETFLSLIEQDYLKIDLISRISKSGPDKGRYRNKNVVFSIKKDDIDKLFDCCYKMT